MPLIVSISLGSNSLDTVPLSIFLI